MENQTRMHKGLPILRTDRRLSPFSGVNFIKTEINHVLGYIEVIDVQDAGMKARFEAQAAARVVPRKFTDPIMEDNFRASQRADAAGRMYYAGD